MQNWIKSYGSYDKTLANDVLLRVENKIAQKDFSKENIHYVDKLDVSLTKGSLKVSDERLEKLRALCQIWYVDLKQGEISSHRKYIGPLIVTFKKAVFPVIRFFMKDFLRQQRSFNAKTISLLADLCNEKK